ncbi:hypothetical protein EB796_017325 [Bugula neritina]|uniref:Uncharacterized protein n=1 Tax=Bugula neritina TaxID=10212 RepID=A0A7J7JE35_BUGNE|nr:hypothetical protein EB796_017325 [Bugula neritina]
MKQSEITLCNDMIYTPRDVLKDSAILESLHVLPSSVQNDKVALVMADLCYMINLCYGDGDNLLSDNKVHSFLLAMRAFITTKGKEPVLVAICQSHCNLRHLKVHFTYLFGMVTVDTLSTPSLMAQNKTMKAKR